MSTYPASDIRLFLDPADLGTITLGQAIKEIVEATLATQGATEAANGLTTANTLRAAVEGYTRQAQGGELMTAEYTPQAGWTMGHGLHPDMVTTQTTGSGTATYANGMAVLSTNGAANSSATMTSVRSVRISPGMGIVCRLGATFSAMVDGSEAIIGLGDAQNGYFFYARYVGGESEYGVIRRINGVDEYKPSADWEYMDLLNMPGGLDMTKGKNLAIMFDGSGFGAVLFAVANPNDGRLITAATMPYGEAQTIPQPRQIAMKLYARVSTGATAGTVTLSTPSAVAGILNSPDEPLSSWPFAFSRSTFVTKGSITTEVPILSLRNKTTFNGFANQVRARAFVLTGNADSNINPLIIRVYIGGTLTNAVFTDVDATRSVMSRDTTATVYNATGARLVTITTGAKGEPIKLDLANIYSEWEPGETLTITASCQNSTSANLVINWVEFFG